MSGHLSQENDDSILLAKIISNFIIIHRKISINNNILQVQLGEFDHFSLNYVLTITTTLPAADLLTQDEPYPSKG